MASNEITFSLFNDSNDVNQFLNEFQESGKTNHERALTMFDAMHLFEDHIDHNDGNSLFAFFSFSLLIRLVHQNR